MPHVLPPECILLYAAGDETVQSSLGPQSCTKPAGCWPDQGRLSLGCALDITQWQGDTREWGVPLRRLSNFIFFPKSQRQHMTEVNKNYICFLWFIGQKREKATKKWTSLPSFHCPKLRQVGVSRWGCSGPLTVLSGSRHRLTETLPKSVPELILYPKWSFLWVSLSCWWCVEIRSPSRSSIKTASWSTISQLKYVQPSLGKDEHGITFFRGVTTAFAQNLLNPTEALG